MCFAINKDIKSEDTVKKLKRLADRLAKPSSDETPASKGFKKMTQVGVGGSYLMPVNIREEIL